MILYLCELAFGALCYFAGTWAIIVSTHQMFPHGYQASRIWPHCKSLSLSPSLSVSLSTSTHVTTNINTFSGHQNLHIMDECLASPFISYIFTKICRYTSSIFTLVLLTPFHKIISRCVHLFKLRHKVCLLLILESFSLLCFQMDG